MPPGDPIDDGGMVWPGGTPYFDERTGRYIFPVEPPQGGFVPTGDPHILPFPYPPDLGYPQPWPEPGTPVPIQPEPDLPPRQFWRGGDRISWGPDAYVAEAKARRRAAMQGNG